MTYDDPVLAVALDWATTALASAGAADQGSELRRSSVLRWALAGARAFLNRQADGFLSLAARTPMHSIVVNEPVLRIALVGDAGYHGAPQEKVIWLIKRVQRERPFDAVVHLGDTYFAGGEADFLSNLLAPFSSIDARFLTLCGNHDLYHGPAGFEATLGILRQPGRYFLIESQHWRVAALDTSLAAATFLSERWLS